ncbi:SH3 domain-containing protein [Methyloceanibacter sp.]|uniref:SH3 domain-containing protein n=1 Tax=Methyloceanibacter sp. TaxID=1965321 RepID=UPI003D6DA0CC
MKRLLLSACLVGVVFAGYPPKFPQTNQATPATTLPLEAERGVTIVPKNRNVQRVAYRPSATDVSQPATLKGSPLAPTVEAMFEPALPQTAESKDENRDEVADQNAMWVKVIRGATVHSGPSVSAPVVSYLAVGKELHLVDSQQDWFQVFDPATGQRGWVYAKYYVEPIDRPSGKRVVAVQEPQAPVEAAPAPVQVAPSKAVRRVLQQPQFLAPPQVQVERAQPSRPWLRDDSVASLLDRAFRR